MKYDDIQLHEDNSFSLTFLTYFTIFLHCFSAQRIGLADIGTSSMVNLKCTGSALACNSEDLAALLIVFFFLRETGIAAVNSKSSSLVESLSSVEISSCESTLGGVDVVLIASASLAPFKPRPDVDGFFFRLILKKGSLQYIVETMTETK